MVAAAATSARASRPLTIFGLAEAVLPMDGRRDDGVDDAQAANLLTRVVANVAAARLQTILNEHQDESRVIMSVAVGVLAGLGVHNRVRRMEGVLRLSKSGRSSGSVEQVLDGFGTWFPTTREVPDSLTVQLRILDTDSVLLRDFDSSKLALQSAAAALTRPRAALAAGARRDGAPAHTEPRGKSGRTTGEHAQ